MPSSSRHGGAHLYCIPMGSFNQSEIFREDTKQGEENMKQGEE
jgi:hypothetical protein